MLIMIVITIIHLNSELIFVLIRQANDHFSQQKYKRVKKKNRKKR